MIANKYANLPDIDTAQDIYETEDIFPSTAVKGESSDDEASMPSRVARARAESTGREELDTSNLIDRDVASQKFRKAERRYDRFRAQYAYPPSPTSPNSPAKTRPIPLSQRLRALQTELSTLEAEISDPTNPLLAKEKEEDSIDPGELIRGLVDVRGRLDGIRRDKEGRAKLVNLVLGKGDASESESGEEESEGEEKPSKKKLTDGSPEARNIVEMDRRVGELEKLFGSATTSLDDTSLLPTPILPLITRLNSQLTLLTQPRHLDSISRRLKLLLSDLDRASASQHGHRRHPSQSNGPPPITNIQEQLLPLLSRLEPSLPHIPHILMRLRTLSALHTSAGEFDGTLRSLEEDQATTRGALNELESAVKKIETSLEENKNVVRGNVSSLEERVDSLMRRLDDLAES